MKNYLRLLSLFFVWVVLTGMGKAPGPDVPKPEIDFKVTVRDDQDITTRLQHASWDGNIFFTGTRGRGTVTISFEKVKKAVNMGTGSANKADFQITLRSGDVVAVSLPNDARLLGITSFGTFRILVQNIKEINFE
ncbi:MAG: hypothetical protein A3J24_13165 [Deltaproteobacteria bacterium RIFCSPLOWO2_02_FULL_53_8]|nr:MAG: hypothetical protein A3J24_13165 [Deltaproteobacteria bacterium RIFCSPLOWO2_02_FULL_53_8]